MEFYDSVKKSDLIILQDEKPSPFDPEPLIITRRIDIPETIPYTPPLTRRERRKKQRK